MTENRLNWCNACDRIVKSEADLDDVLGYCAECFAEAEEATRCNPDES